MSADDPVVLESTPTRRAFLTRLAAATVALLAGPAGAALAATRARKSPAGTAAQYAEDAKGVRKTIAALRGARVPEGTPPAFVMVERRLARGEAPGHDR